MAAQTQSEATVTRSRIKEEILGYLGKVGEATPWDIREEVDPGSSLDAIIGVLKEMREEYMLLIVRSGQDPQDHVWGLR